MEIVVEGEGGGGKFRFSQENWSENVLQLTDFGRSQIEI